MVLITTITIHIGLLKYILNTKLRSADITIGRKIFEARNMSAISEYLVNISRIIWGIFLLREKPQSIPYSTSLLKLVLCLDFAMHVVSIYVANTLLNSKIEKVESKIFLNFFDSIIISAAAMFIIFFTVFFVLTLFNKRDRLVQLLTTMYSIDLLITIFMVTWMIVLHFTIMALLLFILLLYWQYMVYIHVFIEGFDFSVLTSGLFALAYIILQHNIAEMLARSLTAVGAATGT